MADLLAGAAWEAGWCRPGEKPMSWLPATVPGTAAGVLREAGLPVGDLDSQDWWWRTTLPACTAGVLHLDGLATAGEVWLGGALILRSTSMFVASSVEVSEVTAGTELRVVCRALAPLLAARRPRPAWRTRLVERQNLRFFRTALLGRLASGSGVPAPVGPWRGLRLLADEPLESLRLWAEGVVVRVDAALATPATSATLTVGDMDCVLAVDGVGVHGALDCSQLARWWPTGYGEPARHEAVLSVDGVAVHRAMVGLREVAAGRSASDGLAVDINDRRIFCRGAVWNPLDPVSLQPDPAALRRTLTTLTAAGLNMVRLPGTNAYESEVFHDLCDELGILVWQDLALANLQPPAGDEAWLAVLDAEVAQLSARLSAHASTAVVCGGSEVGQQAVMMGVDPGLAPLHDRLRSAFPTAVWVDDSPSGGERPFTARPGVTHWFGVGAYLQPLDSVLHADVGFASECLAFSIPPEPALVRELGGAAIAGHHPDWKAGVPRDRGAGWDFEDVTGWYVRELFGVDPTDVRWTDPTYALDLARAAVVEAMTSTFAAWRAGDCGGGLVLAANDLVPGAGWGLLDVAGMPKAPLQALRDVLAPTALLVCDQGLDGVLVRLVADGGMVVGQLSLEVWDSGGVLVESAVVAAAPTVDVEAALGGFRDLNGAHRFGPPRFDVLRARLVGTDVETTHLLRGPRRERVADVGLTATVDGLTVTVRTVAASQRVALDVPGFVPDVGWFHLAPGCVRTVVLRRAGAGQEPPRGNVRALNARADAPLS